MAEESPLRVYYDSACPLCRREVAFYRRIAPGQRVAWLDLHDPGVDPAADGIARERALGRLHAVAADGRALSGARAFTAIWRRVPRLRPFGIVLGLPPFVWLGEGLYRLFLGVRPGLSRVLARRCGRGRRSPDRSVRPGR